MSVSNEDLEDYVEKFRNIFYKQNDYKINETDMWSLIDNLIKELDLCKERENSLQKNLTKYLESENADVTAKFITLGEKYYELEKENTDLKNEISVMQLQKTTDVDTLTNNFSSKLTELEDKYKHEVTCLKEQIANEKNCYEAKEKELYNEIQLAHASGALQCDEIESNLKRQLVDANSKLRNSQNIIRDLKIEINGLKSQLASQQTQCRPKPSKPEIRFDPLPITTTNRPLENYDEYTCDELEYFEAPPPVRNTTPISSCSTPIFRHNTALNRKYEVVKIPPVFKGNNRIAPKTVTPPTNNVKKKRKLYDPNTFDPSNLATL